MALIKCSECDKEISDRANSCVHCGNPITRFEANKVSLTKIECPELPVNLDIGKMEKNWTGEAVLKGYLDINENVLDENIKSGDIKIFLHKSGLAIKTKWLIPVLDIHNSQIIDLKTASHQELESADKNVIGRAVAGQLLFGPVGAVIGGLSGVGKKEKLKEKHYLIINYWNTDRTPRTLVISGKQGEIRFFIETRKKRLNKEVK